MTHQKTATISEKRYILLSTKSCQYKWVQRRRWHNTPPCRTLIWTKTVTNAKVWLIFCQGYSQTAHFDWHIIQQTRPHKFTTLHCCNRNTSNMAAFIVVDRIMPRGHCNPMYSLLMCEITFFSDICCFWCVIKLNAMNATENIMISILAVFWVAHVLHAYIPFAQFFWPKPFQCNRVLQCWFGDAGPGYCTPGRTTKSPRWLQLPLNTSFSIHFRLTAIDVIL